MSVNSNLSNESKVLIDLLANSLFNAEIKIDLNNINLKTLFNEAWSQTVLALAFDSLPSDARSQNEELYDSWQLLSFSVIQKNAKQLYSNSELEIVFNNANIPICTIKGFASNYFYGDKKHLRQMGDIDFIVPVEKISDSKNLLLNNGFECMQDEEDHDFHIAFKKNDELYEMHKGITSLLDGNENIEKYIADIFRTSAKSDFDSAKITIPDVFSHGLIMLLHMKRHMLTGGGVGLRHLCDWAVFVNSIENSKWEIVFKEKLNSINLWKFAQVLSKACNIYLKIPEQKWFSEIDTQIADNLLSDIILSGNFGKKDIKRYQEILFLSKTIKDENKLVFYAKGLINKIYSWKPFYKRHKFLLPFGIIAYVLRTLFLIIFRKKKYSFSDTHKSGKLRNDLYSKLFK